MNLSFIPTAELAGIVAASLLGAATVTVFLQKLKAKVAAIDERLEKVLFELAEIPNAMIQTIDSIEDSAQDGVVSVAEVKAAIREFLGELVDVKIALIGGGSKIELE